MGCNCGGSKSNGRVRPTAKTEEKPSQQIKTEPTPSAPPAGPVAVNRG